MSSQDTTLLLYPVMSKCRYAVSAIQTFSNKSKWCNNWIIKIQELSSPKGELAYTLPNSYNDADLMFLFKEGLSLIIKRLSLNSNRNFVFSLVRTLKFPKDGEWLQSNKLSLAALPLGLTFFLVNGKIPICSPILTLRCLTHSP